MIIASLNCSKKRTMSGFFFFSSSLFSPYSARRRSASASESPFCISVPREEAASCAERSKYVIRITPFFAVLCEMFCLGNNTPFFRRESKKTVSERNPANRFFLEAPPGFEPGSQGFADPCLTSWLWRQTRPETIALGQNKNSAEIYVWSGKRDSNPRHSPWQGDALPLSYSRIFMIPRCIGGNNRARTCDPLLVRQMLSQLSYASELA